jgi:hypothetical protein
LVIVVMFEEDYKQRNSSLRNFFRPYFISSLLGLNILFSAVFSNKFILCSFYSIRDS